MAGYGTSEPRLRWLTTDERLVDELNDGWYFAFDVTDVRPLVVLDLSWADSVPVLIDQLRGAGYVYLADQIEAQTKPPRIPEPGLWGVVEDGGEQWVRGLEGWVRATSQGMHMNWYDLIDPVLVREGVA
jgi:hypothetical protein